MMATIYARSGLIFVATAASDGIEGCFHPKMPNMIRRVGPLQVKDTGGLYGTNGPYLCSRSSYGEVEVERLPLPGG